MSAQISRESQTAIEVLLPHGFAGFLSLESEHGATTEVFCDSHTLEPGTENVYQVDAADIPLYSDKQGEIQRQGVVGLLLRVIEAGGRPFARIVPTRVGRYRAGQYVTHGPFENDGVDETWYRDPRSGQIHYAWTGALIARPEVLGEAGEDRCGGIRVLPSIVHTEVNVSRTLHVRAYMIDGPVRKEEDVTRLARWKSSDEQIAFVKGGVVYPKRFGSITVEAEWQGFLSSIAIEVAYLSPGQRTVYYQGLRRLQQIRFDDEDNLYIVNQSQSVYRLARSGGLKEVARIVIEDTYPIGLDCVCVDRERNLIVGTPYKDQCLRFRWDGRSYSAPELVAQSVRGTKKSIAAAQDGTLYVAVMTGYIVRVRPNGTEDAFRTRDATINVAIGPNGLIHTTSKNERAVHVYTPDGDFVETIPHGINDSPADLLLDPSGAVYLPFFRSGKLLRISSGELSHAAFVADELGTPGGIAMDSRGRVYTSDFSGDVIHLVNKPGSLVT